MIGMYADEKRMIFLQHRAEFRRDSLWQEDRNAGADAQKFKVRNCAKLAEQMFQSFIAEQQRVATAQKHIANFGMIADIFDLLVELRMKVVTSRIADKTR